MTTERTGRGPAQRHPHPHPHPHPVPTPIPAPIPTPNADYSGTIAGLTQLQGYLDHLWTSYAGNAGVLQWVEEQAQAGGCLAATRGVYMTQGGDVGELAALNAFIAQVLLTRQWMANFKPLYDLFATGTPVITAAIVFLGGLP